MTLDQWISIGILLVGFAGVVFPLHLDNRRKAKETAHQQELLLNKVWRKLKQHDKKTRQTRAIARDVVGRLSRVEEKVGMK